MRRAVLVENGKVVNSIILEEGAIGDEAISVLGCIEVTNFDVIPEIGWNFDGQSFFYIPTEEEVKIKEMVESRLKNLESAKAKLFSLGLTEEEAKAVLGI